MHTLAHHTLILCDNNDVHRVYDLCRKDYFDDYILFWPMTHDTPRLRMAVRHALRDLEHAQTSETAAKIAAQARRIAELEGLLDQQLSEGERRAQAAENSLVQNEAEINAAICQRRSESRLILAV